MRLSFATAACVAVLALSAPAFAEDAKPASTANESMKSDATKTDHMKAGQTGSMKSSGGMMKKDAMGKKGSMNAH